MKSYVPIVTYHAIVGGECKSELPAEASRAHAVRAADFCAQLDFLAARNYQTILSDRLAGPLSDKAVMITFDDGYASHRFAADELIRRGFGGVFYVTVSKLGEDGYLRHTDVRDVHNQGIEIGSHCFTHSYLTRLNDDDLKRELNESKTRLEDLVRSPINTIAVPYGAYDQRVLDATFAAGYARVMSTDTGLARAGSARVLPRISISASTTLAVFESKLTAGRMATLRRRIVRGLVRRIRRVTGSAAQSGTPEIATAASQAPLQRHT